MKTVNIPAKACPVVDEVDVLVVGGGAAGIGAAIGAAQCGASVALVEYFGALGGLLTNGYVTNCEAGVAISGDKILIKGVFDKLVTRMVEKGGAIRGYDLIRSNKYYPFDTSRCENDLQITPPSSEAFAALIVLMMPASAPYYMVVTATIIAVLVKEAFGGEGHYPFHPAAVGLVAATLAWPRDMSSYPAPGTVLALFSSTGVVLTQGNNTTLSAGGLPSDSTINLLTGNVAGPLGCCAILVIVACGLYLLVRGHMQLSTFVPYLAVCVLVPWLLPNLNELPALSAPWEYVRQRIYLEKYILLSGSMLFGGIFLACEPVVQPNRWSSRLIYGLFLGAMATAFRYYSVYETGVCFAIVLAGAFPEWLDRLAQRAERIRFMRKEEKRLAQHREP